MVSQVVAFDKDRHDTIDAFDRVVLNHKSVRARPRKITEIHTSPTYLHVYFPRIFFVHDSWQSITQRTCCHSRMKLVEIFDYVWKTFPANDSHTMFQTSVQFAVIAYNVLHKHGRILLGHVKHVVQLPDNLNSLYLSCLRNIPTCYSWDRSNTECHCVCCRFPGIVSDT